MLMQAFHGNGIDFAQPVVQVSGDDKETAAATLAARQRQIRRLHQARPSQLDRVESHVKGNEAIAFSGSTMGR